METSIKSSAINYGLYLGGILAVSTVFAYAVNLGLFTKFWYGIGLLIVVIVLGVISCIKSKKILEGFISFKQAFSSYFITVAIGLIISSLISMLLFNFIDTEAALTLKNLMLDSQVDMLRKFNTSEEIIAKTVEEFEKQDNLFSIGNILQGIGFQLVGYSIVGLIVALIMKTPSKQEE